MKYWILMDLSYRGVIIWRMGLVGRYCSLFYSCSLGILSYQGIHLELIVFTQVAPERLEILDPSGSLNLILWLPQDELASLIRRESDVWRGFIQRHADMVSKDGNNGRWAVGGVWVIGCYSSGPVIQWLYHLVPILFRFFRDRWQIVVFDVGCIWHSDTFWNMNSCQSWQKVCPAWRAGLQLR